jgi:AhpD family alkylhydroperoxidase
VVERRTKELVYLTASFANRCLYCSTAHRAAGGKAGVTDQEMAALEAGDSSGFSGAELAAIQYAAALTRTATADRGPLEAHFSQEQIVELTLVCAMANFTNRFNNGLGVQPE